MKDNAEYSDTVVFLFLKKAFRSRTLLSQAVFRSSQGFLMGLSLSPALTPWITPQIQGFQSQETKGASRANSK